MSESWDNKLFDILAGCQPAPQKPEEVLDEIIVQAEKAWNEPSLLFSKQELIEQASRRLQLFEIAMKRKIPFVAAWENHTTGLIAEEYLKRRRPKEQQPSRAPAVRRGRLPIDPDGAMRALSNRPESEIPRYIDVFMNFDPIRFPNNASVVDYLIQLEMDRTGSSIEPEERKRLRSRMEKKISRARQSLKKRLISI